MGLVVLAWLAYLFFVFQVINHRIVIGGFIPSIVIIAVLFFVLFFWSFHRLTKPKKAQRAAAQRTAAPPPAAAQAADGSVSITFRVAGVTFENDNGESRQDILRHLKFGDAPYANDPDDLDGQLEETSYDGEPAIAVLVNGYQVGFVPKSHISRVSQALKSVATCYVSDVKIIGGRDSEGNQLNYGCEITLEY